MAKIDIQITPGTLGKRDWVYGNANPISTVNRFSEKDFYCIGTRDYDTWMNNEPESIFSNLQQGKRYQGTFYKSALWLDEYKAFWLFSNVDGETTGTRFASSTRLGLHEVTYSYYFYDSLWGNGDYADFDGVFYGGIPAFTDKDKLKAYLLDDDPDYTKYDGFNPSKEVPDEVIEDNNISEDIDGLGDGSSLTDGATQTISGGILSFSGGCVREAVIDSENYRKLGTALGGGWLSGNIGDGIISIKLIRTPGTIPTLTETNIIKAGDTTIQGKRIENQLVAYNMGSFKFNEQFNNFLDYSPYTSIKIYLPYCGIQSLDAQVVIGKVITVKCVIDYLTGNLVYYLFYQTNIGDTCLYSWNGNCACEVPITADDYGRKISTAVGLSTTALATLMNPSLGAVAGLGQAGLNYAENGNRHMIMGSVSGNNGFGAIQYPYLLITRPNPQIPSNFAHTTGYLSMETKSLGSVSGYTKVKDVHLSGFSGATSDELSEIESLLKDGVIL